jgi:hypothetical protein
MYLYHADAIGLAGVFTRPVRQTIESQASCALSPFGGIGSARIDNFSFQNLISFDSARSDVTGGIATEQDEEIYVSRTSVVIEGLNILNMLTADRIVGRLVSEQSPNAGEPSIITIGSHFEGLRIAGHAVQVEMAHDLFSELPTYKHWQDAWKRKGAARSKIADSLMGSGLRAMPKISWHLQDVYRSVRQQQESPELKPPVLCSLVKQVNGIESRDINTLGPIITIPQFGTIYLGEAIIAPGSRRLNMLRLQMGSPDAGVLAVGCAALSGNTSTQVPQLPADRKTPPDQ